MCRATKNNRPHAAYVHGVCACSIYTANLLRSAYPCAISSAMVIISVKLSWRSAVVRAATKRGVVVPEQLSVVGYDNSPLVEMENVPLTTVNQPADQMAAVPVRF